MNRQPPELPIIKLAATGECFPRPYEDSLNHLSYAGDQEIPTCRYANQKTIKSATGETVHFD